MNNMKFPHQFAHFKKARPLGTCFLKRAKASRCVQRLLCNSKLLPFMQGNMYCGAGQIKALPLSSYYFNNCLIL